MCQPYQPGSFHRPCTKQPPWRWGCTKDISLALVDDLSPGDYVLVHVGYALSRISPEEAERTLALMAEVAQFAEPPTSAVPQGGEGAP
jgi:hydrogenase expression/formation protein HypC